MASRLSGSHDTIRQRRGPRHQLSGEPPQMDSESLRFFREQTDGLSNRLPLPSIEGMRAGTVNNPISLMRRFITAMRSAGLPKERAMRVMVWMQREIDARWPMEPTPLRALEERAMVAEAHDDRCEKRNDLEHSAITMRERIQSLINEIAADQLCLARLEREMEQAQ